MPGKVRKASMVKTIIPGTISRSPFLISNPVYLSGWIARSYHLTILLSLEEPLPLYFFCQGPNHLSNHSISKLCWFELNMYFTFKDFKGHFSSKAFQVTIFLASSSAKIVPQRRQGRGASHWGLWLLMMWGSNHLNHWVLVVLIGIDIIFIYIYIALW